MAVVTIDDHETEKSEYAGVRLVIPAETKQLGVKLGYPAEQTFRILDNDGNLIFHTYTSNLMLIILQWVIWK